MRHQASSAVPLRAAVVAERGSKQMWMQYPPRLVVAPLPTGAPCEAKPLVHRVQVGTEEEEEAKRDRENEDKRFVLFGDTRAQRREENQEENRDSNLQ